MFPLGRNLIFHLSSAHGPAKAGPQSEWMVSTETRLCLILDIQDGQGPGEVPSYPWSIELSVTLWTGFLWGFPGAGPGDGLPRAGELLIPCRTQWPGFTGHPDAHCRQWLRVILTSWEEMRGRGDQFLLWTSVYGLLHGSLWLRDALPPSSALGYRGVFPVGIPFSKEGEGKCSPFWILTCAWVEARWWLFCIATLYCVWCPTLSCKHKADRTTLQDDSQGQDQNPSPKS